MECEEILKKAGLGPEEVKKISDDIQTRISEGDDFQSILKQINQDLPDIDFTTRMAAVSAVKKASTLKEMRRRVFDDTVVYVS